MLQRQTEYSVQESKKGEVLRSVRAKYLTGYPRLTMRPVFKWLIPSAERLGDEILHHILWGKC